MSFLKSLKPNKPVASLEGYFMAILGKSKFGKTTFAIDLVRKHYNGDMSKALLLATEVGYKTMPGVYAIPITGFDYAEEDDGEQRGFIETVDELIENKNEIPFRFIIIDTITALERYAISYVIKKTSREDSKRYTDISDIPWGKGYNIVAEEIYKQIDRLKKSGFGVLIVGHEKTRKITNRDGFEYDYTTFNVLTKTSDIIEREADMIIYGDMLVEEGENGKAVTHRKLRFRSDGNILCGTRFRNFPSEIEYDVDLFLETFKNAVLGLYDGDEKAVEEAQEEEKKAMEEKDTKLVERQKKVEELHREIQNIVKDFDQSTKLGVAKQFKDLLGNADFRKSDNVELLEEALEFVKQVKDIAE